MSPGATAVQRTDSPLLGIVVGDANRGRHADLRVLGHKMMTWIAGRLYQYGDGNATTFVVVGWIGIFVGLFSTSYGKHGRICPAFRRRYSFTVQLQSAGGTCASRKSATR